jgi:hypothetical protein
MATVDTNLTVTNPNQLSLSDMLNMARGAQAYQQAQQINPLAVQQQQAVTQGAQAQATMQQQAASEQQAVKNFLSNPDNYQDENGNADYSKLQKNVMALAPTTGSAIIQNIANTQTAQTNAKQSFLNLGKSERDVYNAAIGPLAYANVKDPESYVNAVKFAQKINPENKEFVQHGDDLINLINTNPNSFISSALDKVRGSQSATEQEANLAQKAGTVSTPAGTFPTVTTAQQPNQQPTTTVQNAQPLVAANAATNVNTMNEDVKATTAAAQSAPQTLNILKTIKETAPQALTETGGDKRSYAIKLGEVLGIHTPFDENATATDIFKKESAMLQASGNTDAARIINAFANPNTKMTKEAIEQTANQLIAQKQLEVAKQKLFNNFSNDPNTYVKRLGEWNSFADPKILEYKLMDRNQQQNYFAKLGVDAKGRHEDVDANGLTKRQNEFTNKLKVFNRLNDQYQLGL